MKKLGTKFILTLHCLIFIILIVACSPVPTSFPTESPVHKPPPTDDNLSLDTVAPILTSTIEIQLTPTVVPLSKSGPWLIIKSRNGIWAMNSDGSGLTRIVDDYIYGYPSPQPFGNKIAYITEDLTESYSLFLLDLSTGIPNKISGLTNPEFNINPEEYNFALDFYASITDANDLTWSHDGKYLAFVGAQVGPSPDLYVYSVESGEVTQLTDGPTIAADPVWSPDDRNIVHVAATELNYESAPGGYSMKGIWSASVDGDDIHIIYPSEIHGYERVLGWISDTKYVSRTSEFPCENEPLWLVDINEGPIRKLWTGAIDQTVMNSHDGILLVQMPEDPGGMEHLCNFHRDPGFYLVSPQDGSSFLISDLDSSGYSRIYWDEESSLFMIDSGDQLVSVDAEGNISTISNHGSVYGSIDVSPDGNQFVAPLYEGLFLGDFDGSSRMIHKPGDGNIYGKWTPDGKSILIFDHANYSSSVPISLYIADYPKYKPSLISDLVELEGISLLFWVKPSPE